MNGRAVLVWLMMLSGAVANGALRDLVITPRIGDRAGRAVSSVILACVIILIGRLAAQWIGLRDSRSAWIVGATWVAMTLAFEFLAGHYLFGNPWERILAEYDLARGRIWLVVLVATLLAPVLGRRIETGP